ncbi:hypothetical protein RM844_18005 [Streptomyces sp. DSM 44915]|uniref:SMI1/KNR4 family protein n=1 Tax=Streptomyces chisholmiae TaxID=3075540 RepID=A0ABU2JT62_9ACTN|nr:hypothetical protein [Streptomyces sp. DSM 44915]MDT0268180.1 hypothetical protein [Streptomyces sp. DSM 44915]
MAERIAELDRLTEYLAASGVVPAEGFRPHPLGAESPGYPGADDRLRTFATATSTGSSYAIWLRDDRAPLASLPVVFLADEGGLGLVARDFREFLRVLATGWSPWGGWHGVEYDDEDTAAEEGEGAAFRAWLAAEFGIAPATDPNEVVRATEAELWEPFAAWIGPLYPDVVAARATPGGP